MCDNGVETVMYWLRACEMNFAGLFLLPIGNKTPLVLPGVNKKTWQIKWKKIVVINECNYFKKKFNKRKYTKGEETR